MSCSCLIVETIVKLLSRLSESFQRNDSELLLHHDILYSYIILAAINIEIFPFCHFNGSRVLDSYNQHGDMAFL